MGRFCVYSEPAFSVMRWKFLDRLSGCKLLKKELVFIFIYFIIIIIIIIIII